MLGYLRYSNGHVEKSGLPGNITPGVSDKIYSSEYSFKRKDGYLFR